MLTWDLLTEIFDFEFLKSHPSVVHQSIAVFLRNQELYCVKVSALKFLNKVSLSLMANSEELDHPEPNNQDLESERSGSLQSHVEMMSCRNLLECLNRQGFIS